MNYEPVFNSRNLEAGREGENDRRGPHKDKEHWGGRKRSIANHRKESRTADGTSTKIDDWGNIRNHNVIPEEKPTRRIQESDRRTRSRHTGELQNVYMRKQQEIMHDTDREIRPFKTEQRIRGIPQKETTTNTCAECRRNLQKELTLYEIKYICVEYQSLRDVENEKRREEEKPDTEKQ